MDNKKGRIELDYYVDFVQSVTSSDAKDTKRLSKRLIDMEERNVNYVNIALLTNATMGLSGECGELLDLLKKCAFQGKELNREVRLKMKDELGDIIWYWINACIAIDFDPKWVINANIDKLKGRYPSGKFKVSDSENRGEND